MAKRKRPIDVNVAGGFATIGEDEKTDCDYLRDAVVRIGRNRGYQKPELYPLRLIQHEKALQKMEG